MGAGELNIFTFCRPFAPQHIFLMMIFISMSPNRPTITLSMDNRTGKQCRERYVNHLDPEMKKTAWTSEEDNVIRDMFPEFETKWSKYMVLLPGRSDNAIKNRYHMISRNNFECVKNKTPTYASNKRSKPSSDYVEETDTDSNNSTTELSSGDVNRARLLKLLAARVVLDREILDLENDISPNDHSPSLTSNRESDSVTPPSPSNRDIYSGFNDEPAGENDYGFDFDSAWMDEVMSANVTSHENSTSAW